MGEGHGNHGIMRSSRRYDPRESETDYDAQLVIEAIQRQGCLPAMSMAEFSAEPTRWKEPSPKKPKASPKDGKE
jgi:hypothetical protein